MQIESIVRSSILCASLVGCGSTGEQDSVGLGGGNELASSPKCENKATGTQFAPCSDDSDCYSGFCDYSGNPGPYCFVPTRAARDEGHGYGCTSNDECLGVLPVDAVDSGIAAECRNDDIYAGCMFFCEAGTSTSASSGDAAPVPSGNEP